MRLALIFAALAGCAPAPLQDWSRFEPPARAFIPERPLSGCFIVNNSYKVCQ